MTDKTPALLQGIGQAMKHLSQRQLVISQNIANGDTPGYKAREVEAPRFADLVEAKGKAGIARPKVQLSDAMQALGASQRSGGDIVLDQSTTETKPDGNNVTLEEQVMKLGTVQADFAALTNLYRKQMQLLKIATGRGGNG